MFENTLKTALLGMVLVALAASGCATATEIRSFPTTKRAVSELKAGEAVAVVGDFPVIAYEARESAGRLTVGGPQFEKETMGIGIAKDSVELQFAIAHALIKINNDKTYLNTLVKWAVAQGKVPPPAPPEAAPVPTDVPQLKDGELKVGMELTYPPMEFFDEFKKEAGVDVELATALAQAMGVEVSFIDMPFDALIGAAETGKVDIIMSSMAITDERSKRLEFIPYLSFGSGILVEKGNPLGIRMLKDLCGRVVAVQNGTSQLKSLQALVCE
jgi:ABC-type amino acid transport substrate-binding protein